MSLRPAGAMTLNNQQPALKRGTGITVRHESLQVEWDLDKPHPTQGLSPRQQRRAAATNLMAEYN